MLVIVKQSVQPTQHRRDYWNWCFVNGFLASEIADPVLVDPDESTVTVNRLLPVSQPGDPDFPEFRRDESNQPLTEVKVLPLIAPVPDWMVTESGRPLAA